MTPLSVQLPPGPAVVLDSVRKTFGRSSAVDDISLTHRAGRDRRAPRPQRRRQDQHDRHGARAFTARQGTSGLRHVAPTRRWPTAWSPPSCRAAACSRTTRSARPSRSPRPCSPRPARSTRCSDGPGSAHLADRMVGKCSGGEQQRLRFAMALLPDPELLILDEPTTGHGRERSPRVLERHPRGRRARPHRHLRDALPRGGRPVRRPDRAGPAGLGRRRRYLARDQGDGVGPDRPGDAARSAPTTSSPGCPASSRSRSAATP